MLRSRSLAPLRHRPFARLWVGAFGSNIGTWMETVAVGILLQSTTHRATWSGLALAAGFAPNGVLGPVGGALADRISRRVLLLTTTSIQTVLAGVLAALAAWGRPGPVAVILILFASGAANAIGFPSYQAILPDLVPTEDVAGAVALSSAQWNLGRVIGPALAGLVIEFGGYASAFLVNTISFFGVIAVIATLPLPPPLHDEQTQLLRSIRGGVRFASRDPGLRIVLTVIAFASLLAAPFIALVPAVADKVFHEPTVGTWLLVTAQGTGAVAMALVLGPMHARFGSRRTLLTVVGALPLALLGYAAAPALWAAVLAILVVGFLYLGMLSSCTTIAQLRSPAHLRGRVLSLLMALLGLVYPIGAVAQGALGDGIGLRVTIAGAALCLAAALVAIRLLARASLQGLETDAVRHPTRAARSSITV
ncbi:MAG: MFS transporter [Actinobacteria bacterium]|nr:MFS transporter [Actinomycetota bacterium]